MTTQPDSNSPIDLAPAPTLLRERKSAISLPTLRRARKSRRLAFGSLPLDIRTLPREIQLILAKTTGRTEPEICRDRLKKGPWVA